MKTIKDFIYYYRSCPLCGSWVTLDADLPTPTSLEIKGNKLLLTVFERDNNNREYFITLDSNKVESEYPFVFKDVVSTIKRLYYPKHSTSLKIEARCYGCKNFRYWSKTMIYNEKKKTFNKIKLGGERVQFHEVNSSNEKVSYVISNNYNTKETEVYVFRSSTKGKVLNIKMPFSPFKKIDFKDKERILDRIKKILILA